MKVLVDIPDNEAGFGMKVLNSLSFIKKAQPFSKAAESLLIEIKESSKEILLHKKGNLKLKMAEEILNDL